MPSGQIHGLNGYLTEYIPPNTEVVGVRILDDQGRTTLPRYPGIDASASGFDVAPANPLPVSARAADRARRGPRGRGYRRRGANGLGACRRAGVYACNAAQDGLECDAAAAGAPADEECNNLDDDCDGQIDERVALRRALPLSVATPSSHAAGVRSIFTLFWPTADTPSRLCRCRSAATSST